MRILHIAVFMLLFNMALGAIDSMGLFGGAVSAGQTLQTVTPEDVAAIAPENATATQLTAWVTWGSIITSWNTLLKILQAAFLTGYYLKSLLPIVPDSLAAMLTAVINILYAVGFIQFVTNRPFKTMQ